MHLLRNSVDHGIEPPNDREAAGKPRVGRIMVRASVEGNQAVVTVSDDGRGIDPEKVAHIAVARGLISDARLAALSTREKLELVFRPGFSTAKEVTELSGRGMGMEIVREACTRMGGTVSIGRRESGGTVVVLRVPLSMSVVHCIVVRDGGRNLAIPATQVSFVQLVPPAAISRRRRDGYRVRIGTSILQLYFLPPNHSVASSPTTEFEERTVLIVPYRGERVALAVDEIVDEEDQIVKPLPLMLQNVNRLLGAVILGDGTPVPVLNLVPLLDQIGQTVVEPADAKAESPAEVVVLVVDDSLTMRLALTRTLEHAGFMVETARDGQDALEHVRTHGLPQLVTLDIEMPRMDGLETLYALRHMPGGDNVPVFMLSSRTGKKHLRTADKMGATRYFTKPYHDTEFVAAVREVTAVTVAGGSLRRTGTSDPAPARN
jgi:chemosensory pili system protein ChpA (sensor histidine kinase/response regulator)